MGTRIEQVPGTPLLVVIRDIGLEMFAINMPIFADME